MATAAAPVALAPTAAALELILCHLVVPDTETIQKATHELEKATRSSQHLLVPEMVQLIQISQRAEARHMAAVLLRKRLVAHWLKLPVELHTHIKTTLITTLMAEPVPAICHATARAIRCVTLPPATPRPAHPTRCTSDLPTAIPAFVFAAGPSCERTNAPHLLGHSLSSHRAPLLQLCIRPGTSHGNHRF